MIKITNLKKSFGSFDAVRGITFDINEGEVLGFLGPNGAGKSTTMKMLTGFIKPSAGTVTIDGEDVVKHHDTIAKKIGYLPEGAPAYDDMTVMGFLSFVADIRGLTGRIKESRIDHVISQLALEDVKHRSIDALSKGYKRRVGIAQALLHDPKILILDEPTDGLDPNQKHQVRQLIQSLAKDKIVIISTHILEEVSAVCSRAIIIANGELVADGTPASLEAQSRYHQAVTLEVEGDVLSTLQALPEVNAIEQDGERYTLIPNGDEGLFEAVQQCIAKHQWQVKALFVEQGRLDDVFRMLTVKKEAA